HRPTTQPLPPASQPHHPYPTLTRSVPFHVPVLDVNVCPCTNDPEITGADTNDGAPVPDGAAATTAVAADVAVADPAEFDAVTVTPNVHTTAVDTSSYDCPGGPTEQL